ncbi:hypothetical protein J19TS1_39950 [Heyndrickxia oleronia]|nr:hypothetical protein J19TS1_39950 [Heyndrickxia oleronia]
MNLTKTAIMTIKGNNRTSNKNEINISIILFICSHPISIQ